MIWKGSRASVLLCNTSFCSQRFAEPTNHQSAPVPRMAAHESKNNTFACSLDTSYLQCWIIQGLQIIRFDRLTRFLVPGACLPTIGVCSCSSLPGPSWPLKHRRYSTIRPCVFSVVTNVPNLRRSDQHNLHCAHDVVCDMSKLIACLRQYIHLSRLLSHEK